MIKHQKPTPKLWDSEKFAEKILTTIGWEPKKIHPTKQDNNKGMPDFECIGDRYVEVKLGKLDIQLNTWTKLIKDGKKVYLMCLEKKGKDYIYKIYKINLWLEEKNIESLKKITCKICGAKVDWLYHGDLCEKCYTKG
jgi:hypothetical protein